MDTGSTIVTVGIVLVALISLGFIGARRKRR